MDKILASKTFTVKASDLKRAFQEDREFKAPRYGHNNYGIEPSWGRINYMAHGQGYVMARRPRCMPFVISEKLWLSFVPWNGLVHGDR